MERYTTDSGEGRLAENILLFARTLRSAGLAIGTSQVIEALLAAVHVGIERRDDLYWALRAVLIKSPQHTRIFDQAFHMYFRNPRLLERMIALLLPAVPDSPPAGNRDSMIRRLLEAVHRLEQDHNDEPEPVIDRSNSWSHTEVLRQKDFEQMSLAEQAEAKRMLVADIEPLRARPSRRFRANSSGDRFDLRRTLRQMRGGSGQIIPLARKSRAERTPDVTLICDISGSMSVYSRMFLHFAHVLTARQPVVNSFVFGTRLTNISRRMKHRDADVALRSISADVLDWDGGTRIAESLGEFNRHWTRRVLARDSIVVMLSDGLERDTESDLEFQIARLHRSCRRLIWMNPMLRYDQFEAKARGIRCMLPHVDSFVSAHNVNSLTAMFRSLHDRQGGATMRAQEWSG